MFNSKICFYLNACSNRWRHKLHQNGNGSLWLRPRLMLTSKILRHKTIRISSIWLQKLRSRSLSRVHLARSSSTLSVLIPKIPMRSSCCKFGHWLAMLSRSRSVKPRTAVKNSFFNFGQPRRKNRRLSVGGVSSRRHQPKSTSSKSWHSARARRPWFVKDCDFQKSRETISLFVMEIWTAISSIFIRRLLSPTFKCFKCVLLHKICRKASVSMHERKRSRRSRCLSCAKGMKSWPLLE